MFCTDHRAKSGYLSKDDGIIDFYKRAGVCLLRGTQRIFKFSSGQSYCVKAPLMSGKFKSVPRRVK